METFTLLHCCGPHVCPKLIFYLFFDSSRHNSPIAGLNIVLAWLACVLFRALLGPSVVAHSSKLPRAMQSGRQTTCHEFVPLHQRFRWAVFGFHFIAFLCPAQALFLVSGPYPDTFIFEGLRPTRRLTPTWNCTESETRLDCQEVSADQFVYVLFGHHSHYLYHCDPNL